MTSHVIVLLGDKSPDRERLLNKPWRYFDVQMYTEVSSEISVPVSL